MSHVILAMSCLCVILLVVPPSGADEPKPEPVILTVTDYRGLAGPTIEFALKKDGTWTNSVSKAGRNLTTSGTLTAEQSKALQQFICALELGKHTRKRNVEDAAMVSVRAGEVEYLDIAPGVAAKVLDKIKGIREPEDKK